MDVYAVRDMLCQHLVLFENGGVEFPIRSKIGAVITLWTFIQHLKEIDQNNNYD